MNEFNDIITRYILHQATDEELIMLKKWIEESEENALHFQHVCAIWNNANSIQFDSDNAFLKFKENTQIFEKQKINKQKNKYAFLLKRVAIFVLLATVVSVLYFYFNNNNSQLIIVENNNKQPKFIILPDSTFIWLKKGQLSYSSTIEKDKQRLVSLNGEAFFNVRHLKESLFLVKTGYAYVEVVGTQFNISTSDSSTNLYVQEGKVKISSIETPSNFIQVTNNQQARVGSNGECLMLNNNVSSFNNVAWKTRQLFFRNEKLFIVLKEIEENSSKKFIIKNDNIKDELFTGNVNIDSTEYYCKLLHNLYNIKVESEGDSIILY